MISLKHAQFQKTKLQSAHTERICDFAHFYIYARSVYSYIYTRVFNFEFFRIIYTLYVKFQSQNKTNFIFK